MAIQKITQMKGHSGPFKIRKYPLGYGSAFVLFLPNALGTHGL